MRPRWAKAYPAGHLHGHQQLDSHPALIKLHRTLSQELRQRLQTAGTIHGAYGPRKLVASVSIEQERRWLKRDAYAVKELKPA